MVQSELTPELAEKRIRVQVECFELLMMIGAMKEDQIADYGRTFEAIFEKSEIDIDPSIEGYTAYVILFSTIYPNDWQEQFRKAEIELQEYLLERGIISEPEEFVAKKYDKVLALFIYGGLDLNDLVLQTVKKHPQGNSPEIQSITTKTRLWQSAV